MKQMSIFVSALLFLPELTDVDSGSSVEILSFSFFFNQNMMLHYSQGCSIIVHDVCISSIAKATEDIYG